MKKVLVIEDDEPLCILLAKILSKQYQVVIMNNGLEAWGWLTDGNRPDAIVSDINMPLLDGFELLEHLSNSGLFKDIPVIMLSGVKDAIKRDECLRLGAQAFLQKPFEPRILLETIGSILNPNKKVHA